MLQALQFIGVLSSALFAGAAMYINVAEHPARMSCGTELASTVFGPSYKRAATMQVILAGIATISGVVAWVFGAGMAWLVGTVIMFAVIPFTLLAMMPTNKKLLSPSIGGLIVHGNYWRGGAGSTESAV